MSHLTLIARFTAHPTTTDALGKGLADLVAPTLAEAGCIEYRLHRDDDDKCVWILYENWRSRPDLDEHFKKPYTKTLMARFPELLAKDMESNFCSMVSPRP